MQLQKQKQQADRFYRIFFRLLLVASSMIGVFFLLSIALAKAMQQKRLRVGIRRFNRSILNPLTLRIAGNHLRIYAAVQHRGRHSGQTYSTPVVARPLGDGFVIPLPYGKQVDWCQKYANCWKVYTQLG